MIARRTVNNEAWEAPLGVTYVWVEDYQEYRFIGSHPLHAGWLRLSTLPVSVTLCPRCKSPQQTKERSWVWNEDMEEWITSSHNWRWDETEERWLCTRPSCMEEPQRPRINRNVMQTLYASPPR
jgi:hypothetical protein